MVVEKKKKPCRNCGYLTTEKKCANCGSEGYAEKYKGRAVIFDMKRSQVAKKLDDVKINGEFALKYG